MARLGENAAADDRTHLVSIEPVKGRRAWEHASCTCGAERDFSVDGFVEDWALVHTQPASDWIAAKAS
ncbi:MAG TPA: hypothetical protein VEI83_07790 [Acidimicrobiales bacterium]|nr:hypothetical protein [Acidimicrobiales bacterium]